MYARHAGFLPDVAAFDAAAFQRAPRLRAISAAAEQGTCSASFCRRKPEAEAYLWQLCIGHQPFCPFYPKKRR